MERLRQLREEAKLTQEQLAAELNLSQETISGYENHKALPPAYTLMQLADCLHTSIDYLLERSDNKNGAGLWESALSELESELIFFFRKLSPSQRERVLGYVLGMFDDQSNEQ